MVVPPGGIFLNQLTQCRFSISHLSVDFLIFPICGFSLFYQSVDFPYHTRLWNFYIFPISISVDFPYLICP